jgi:hypothetical protein
MCRVSLPHDKARDPAATGLSYLPSFSAPPDSATTPCAGAPRQPTDPEAPCPIRSNASLLNPFNIEGMDREEMKYLAAFIAIMMLLLTVIFHLVMYVIQQFEWMRFVVLALLLFALYILGKWGRP